MGAGEVLAPGEDLALTTYGGRSIRYCYARNGNRILKECASIRARGMPLGRQTRLT